MQQRKGSSPAAAGAARAGPRTGARQQQGLPRASAARRSNSRRGRTMQPPIGSLPKASNVAVRSLFRDIVRTVLLPSS